MAAQCVASPQQTTPVPPFLCIIAQHQLPTPAPPFLCIIPLHQLPTLIIQQRWDHFALPHSQTIIPLGYIQWKGQIVNTFH